MKKYTAVFFAFMMIFYSYAGDSAVLVDNGFSEDGNYYVFAQYGKTDGSFLGWAEIYTVDIAANEYVHEDVFIVNPSSVTSGKSGKKVYEELSERSFYSIRKYKCTPAEPDRILYIRENEAKAGTDEIIFKDFMNSLGNEKSYYKVHLLPEISGSGLNIKSSFFIMLEKQDTEGRILARQKIGSPKIVRKGVKEYKIERIVCDKSGRKLVFIIEKQMEDITGTNIRYMIEAAVLQDSFNNNMPIK